MGTIDGEVLVLIPRSSAAKSMCCCAGTDAGNCRDPVAVIVVVRDNHDLNFTLCHRHFDGAQRDGQIRARLEGMPMAAPAVVA